MLDVLLFFNRRYKEKSLQTLDFKGKKEKGKKKRATGQIISITMTVTFVFCVKNIL